MARMKVEREWGFIFLECARKTGVTADIYELGLAGQWRLRAGRKKGEEGERLDRQHPCVREKEGGKRRGSCRWASCVGWAQR